MKLPMKPARVVAKKKRDGSIEHLASPKKHPAKVVRVDRAKRRMPSR